MNKNNIKSNVKKKKTEEFLCVELDERGELCIFVHRGDKRLIRKFKLKTVEDLDNECCMFNVKAVKISLTDLLRDHKK